MAAASPFRVHQLQTTIRFIQGYRYLDRCGEALVKLENVLAEGWLPTETTPKAGVLKNDQIGMTTSFNLEHSFETEFRADGFYLPTFLKQGWDWAESLRSAIPLLS